jgi:hypothetical protein
LRIADKFLRSDRAISQRRAAELQSRRGILWFSLRLCASALKQI